VISVDTRRPTVALPVEAAVAPARVSVFVSKAQLRREGI